MATTPTQRRIEALYEAETGQNLRQTIRAQRREGLSWRPISEQLTEVLGAELAPSVATLNNWYRHLDDEDDEPVSTGRSEGEAAA